MIRMIHPLENEQDFNKLTLLLSECLNDDQAFRFLSYSLIRFDKETIESLTKNHKENGIEYIIYEKDDAFTGLLAYKANKYVGFELFLLAVNCAHQKSGIGQELISECLKIASDDNFKSVDTLVFADNKKMLRLMIKNDFMPVEIQFHARADGMDLIKLRRYL